QQHAGSPRRRERRIAHELDRIAKALLAVEQQRLAAERAPVPLRPVETRPRRGHFGELPAPFVFLPALLVASRHEQVLRAVDAGVDVPRIERQRAVIGLQGAFEAAAALVQMREIEPALQEIGLQPQRALVVAARPGEVSGLVQEHAEVRMRLAVRGLRLAAPPEILQHVAEVVPGERELRRETQRLAAALQRIVEAALALQQVAEVQVQLGRGGVELEREPREIFRLVDFAELRPGERERARRRNRARLGGERLAIELDRAVHVAGRMALRGALEAIGAGGRRAAPRPGREFHRVYTSAMLTLALPLGNYHGWGVCGKYLSRELARLEPARL